MKSGWRIGVILLVCQYSYSALSVHHNLLYTYHLLKYEMLTADVLCVSPLDCL
jgi:hypothetical protein